MHPIDITIKFFYVNIRDLILYVEEENGAQEGNETFIRYYQRQFQRQFVKENERQFGAHVRRQTNNSWLYLVNYAYLG